MIRRDLLKAAVGLVLGDRERLGWKKGQRVYSFGRERLILVFGDSFTFMPPNNFFAQAEAAAISQMALLRLKVSLPHDPLAAWDGTIPIY